MRRILISAVVSIAAFASVSAYAVDPAAGQKQFEATCAACHGSNGISIAPIYPDLAGQKDQYLVTQLKAFRDGSRRNAIMEPMAKHLTDTQIVDLAAFLAALKPGQ